MCGIVGYIGERQAGPILLEGLEKLEYRGYDSAGIAVRAENGNIRTVKAKGRLKNLAKKTDDGKSVEGRAGVGHTRWATHGEPSEVNAHPHSSEDHSVVLVHNGIIENYRELREKLRKEHYMFRSQTDTEVIAQLIDYYEKKYKGSQLETLSRVMLRLKGSWALAILFADAPGEIYLMKKDSPLVVGKAEDGMYIASDVPALLNRTRRVLYMEDMEMGVVQKDGVRIYNIDLEEQEKEMSEAVWKSGEVEKNGFEHFMMKEIYEQPKAVADTIHAYVKGEDIVLGGLFEKPERIYIVACGSAYHAGVVGKYVLEELAGIPVEVDYASEFRYRNPVFVKNSVTLIISQSGETADSLAALRLAKKCGEPTVAIVNVEGSAIAREADSVIYTKAGPEISVATTKAYSAQLVTLYLLAIALGEEKGKIGLKEKRELLTELKSLPGKIEKVLEDKERLQWFAMKYAGVKNAFFLGRGVDYGISLEGSLKLKEISYIHSEAYAAGEMKHGTISLIEKGTLVTGVLTKETLFEKSISNMAEVKSRGADLLCVTAYGNYGVEEVADFTVYIPKTEPCFMASLAVVPLQLLAYYVSVARGLDVDKPRNLAKSVTVE